MLGFSNEQECDCDYCFTSQATPRSPELEHKSAKHSLWIHNFCNPCWVQEELGRKHLQSSPSSTQIKAERFSLEMEKKSRMMVDRWSESHQCEDMCLQKTMHCSHSQRDNGERLDNNSQSHLYQTNTDYGLVHAYAKQGHLERAQAVFDGLPTRSLISWNSLISGYVQYGLSLQALHCFQQMHQEGFTPDAITLVCVLKACGNISAAGEGQHIFAMIVREGLDCNNRIIGNALLDMYVKCGLLGKAQAIFEELSDQDVISWTTLIAGYMQNGYCENALDCYKRMLLQGLTPNSWTFSCILKTCGALGAGSKGREIHAIIIKQGLLTKDLVLGNALVDMYAKCGHLSRAQEVFDILPKHDVVSWNALIVGYTQYGQCQKALECFVLMKSSGYSPSEVTISCVLKACGSVGAADKGEAIHGVIAKDSLMSRSVSIGTALVDMYCKCGALGKAEKVFNDLLVQNRVSWNALISGYAFHGECEEAFYCFEKMQLAGFVPDETTFICILQTCGNIGAADKGQAIYARMIMEGFLAEDLVIGTALVDMYANCGMLLEAQEVFDRILVHDVVSWSALIGGFAKLGEEDVVQKALHKMILQKDELDSAILTILLSACSHSGLSDMGEMFLEIISTGFGILPNLKHYYCMVDLYGRAGQLDKALTFTSKMPFLNSVMVWHSLLGACKKEEDINLGKLAFEHVLELDEKDVLAYVCMHNIFASAGMKEETQKLEDMGVQMDAWMLGNDTFKVYDA